MTPFYHLIALGCPANEAKQMGPHFTAHGIDAGVLAPIAARTALPWAAIMQLILQYGLPVVLDILQKLHTPTATAPPIQPPPPVSVPGLPVPGLPPLPAI